MPKRAFFAFIVIILLIALLPAQPTHDTLTRPHYQAKVKLDPAERSLKASLNYKLPPGSYHDIVFTVYANAYTSGKEGSFLFPQFYERVFYALESRGQIEVSHIYVNGARADFTLADTALIITPSQPVVSQRPVEVKMDYHMVVPVIGHRNGANAQALWLGHWLPLLAPREGDKWLTYPYYPAGDPQFNQVGDFHVTIELPSEYTLIAPGVIERFGSTANVTATNIREFAIACGNAYTTASRITRQGIELSFYTYGAQPDVVARLLDEVEDMIDFFTAEVGPYPYPALRFVQTSWFLGGMEFPQVVWLSDNTLQNFYSARSTTLHELAHQWFYAVIGNNPVTEAWIDEGLATFFQQRYLQGEGLDAYYASERTVLLPLLKTQRDPRLGQPLNIYPDWPSYYRVNYRRSALMQYELYRLMGKEKYRGFTQSLYNHYKHSELDKLKLIELASKAYGQDLDTWFDPWFND